MTLYPAGKQVAAAGQRFPRSSITVGQSSKLFEPVLRHKRKWRIDCEGRSAQFSHRHRVVKAYCCPFYAGAPAELDRSGERSSCCGWCFYAGGGPRFLVLYCVRRRNSSKATTNKSKPKQPEPSLPSRPVSPPSTIDWIQTRDGIRTPHRRWFTTAFLIVLAVTSVKNLLSKRRARVGDTKRDEDLKAKVRAKTEAGAVTDGLLEIASLDDAETIDTLPASKRGAEVQTKATRVNVRDLPLGVGPD